MQSWGWTSIESTVGLPRLIAVLNTRMKALAGALRSATVQRDTAANWTARDPILGAGEFGFATDSKELKIGDGVTRWTVLKAFARVP